VQDRRLGQKIDQFLKGFGSAIGPEFRRRLIRGGSPADHIGRHGPRSPGKADQRGLGGETGLEPPHRLVDGMEPLHNAAKIEIVELLDACDRIEHRPLALLKGDGLPQRIWDDENVRKKDRRVEAVAPDRLQRHFLGEFRIVAEVEETSGLGTRFSVLGKIAPRLAHQPDWRPVDRQTLERTNQALGLGSGLVTHRHRSLSKKLRI